MKAKHTFTIKALSGSDLLHLVREIMEKKLIVIISLSMQPLPPSSNVLVLAEVMIEGSKVRSLAVELNNIIEVFWVRVFQN